MSESGSIKVAIAVLIIGLAVTDYAAAQLAADFWLGWLFAGLEAALGGIFTLIVVID